MLENLMHTSGLDTRRAKINKCGSRPVRGKLQRGNTCEMVNRNLQDEAAAFFLSSLLSHRN